MAIDLNPTEKKLTSSDGTPIYAVANGNPANNAIVFIHGYALAAGVWDGILRNEQLLKEFYLVAYDLRGCGRSGKPTVPEGHESSLYAADFAAVLKAFDLKKPAIVPWSLGGVVAADICAHLPPGTISGIIYLNAVHCTGPVIQEIGSAPVLSSLPAMLSTTDPVAAAEAKMQFVDFMFSRPEAMPASLKWEWLGMTTVQPPLAAALTVSREQDPSGLYEAAANGLPISLISCPTDSVMLMDKIEEILKSHFKKVEVRYIENGSHAPFIDHKDKFVEALTDLARKTFSSKS